MTKRLHPVATNLTNAAAPRRTLARRAPAPLVLEQRIMFDAAGVEAAVRHAAEHVAADATAPADTGDRSHVAAVAAPAQAQAQAQANGTEVVFIEDNVNNVAQLVAGVRPGIEVIMLDHTRDGLQQMLDALQGHAPVDAIHLVSHGATGQLSLGTQSLSVDNIDSASGALAQLGTSLNAGGDLLLYGCDVAQGATGAGFVERMAALTRADVAASTDVTGSAAFAGNWTLEAHSGAIEAKALELDRAGWSGELVNTVYDANRQTLVFNGAGTGATHIIGTGTSTNDVTRYNSVITIGGQAIDAVVTTTLDRATMIDFDSVTDPSTNAAYFQPTMRVSAAGGGVSFKIDFYLGGTYTGAGTGTAVTLQNVVVNSYDIDSYNASASDRQFQVFQGFDSYELSTSTQLATRVQADGSVQFVYETNTPTNNGPIAADAYRVKVYYDSMSSFVVKSGVAAAASGTFNGQAYFALDFSVGPAWSGTTVKTDTPAPNLSYSVTTFAESSANDGTITATSTITLANGSFTGGDNTTLSGVTFSNLPAGLAALVTKTSATTATLSFTGSALAHANANDINNVGVSFGDAAFVSNRAAAVTGASRADLVLDFADPAPDTIAPVVTPRSDSYAENRAAGTVVSTVSAQDAVGVTGFRFAATGTAQSADGHFAIAANGAITLTASGAAAGSSANDYELTPHTFVMGVQARDAAGNWSAAQNVTLDVTNVDDVAPAFASATSGRALENQAVLYTAAASDNIDFTDRAVTYTLSAGGDAARLTIDANTGVVRLAAGTLDFEIKSGYAFTVQARDASGNVRTQQVTIGVDNVDEIAPAFTSSAATSAPENQNVLYQATATDLADFTDGHVTYQLQAGGDAGLLAIDSATGVVTLAQGNLDFETRARYTFTVQAQDATGNTRNQVVTVAVLDADEVAPTVTITSDRSALAAGTTANLTFTFSEDVGASFTAADIVLDSGSLGTLVKTDATHYTALYTPGAAIQDPAVSISIAAGKVQDSAGNANGTGASLSLAVDTVAPIITGPAAIAVDENTTSVRRFTASEAVTWSLAGGEDAAHFTLAADGTLAFSSAPDFEQPLDSSAAGRNTYVVNVRAVDGAGNATVQAITVSVADVNEAPAGSSTAFQVAEDVRYSGTLPVAVDPDGDTLTYALATAGAHGQAIVNADGTFSYQGAADYHGLDTFRYTVSDGKGGTATYTVAVAVTSVNDAPLAADATIAAVEDQPAAGTLPLAHDADGDSITYALTTAPAFGTATVAADGSYTYNPTANYHGPDAFTYTVSDGQGGSTTHTARITVAAVNDAPVAADVTAGTDEDTPLQSQLPAASDSDGDHVAYALHAGAQHGSATVNADGSYRYTPVRDFNGVDSFTYSVTDGQGGMNVYMVTITVKPVNDAPVGGGAVVSTNEDTPLAGKLPLATDIDGDNVTYAVGTDAQHGSVTINVDGSYLYTPGRDFNGSDSFTYSIVDSSGGTNTYTVTIIVNAVNDAPAGSSITIVAVEDVPKAGQLPAAVDVDGDSITYAVETGPQHGALAINADGSYLYTPAADFHGSDTFSYTVSDGHGGSSTHTASITVGATNDAPVAADASLSTNEDTPLAGTLPVASDIDGDSVTYGIGTGAQHGSVTIDANGSYVYTPARDFHGADSFTYTVADSEGGTHTYTVAITVNPVNDAPVASAAATGSGTVGEAMAPVGVQPFTDSDSAAITYSATRADGTPLPAWIDFDPVTLTFSGTPPAGTDGTLVLLVTGSDGAVAATTSVTLTIRGAAVPTQSVAIAAMSKDTGSSALDFVTADGTANRTVSGTLDGPLGINQVVRVSFDGGATFVTAAVNGTGWTAVDTGAHGADWTIAAHVANSVTGSTGAATTQRVVFDAAAPAAPTVAPVASASTTPVVTGTATLAPGDTLIVTIDGKAYDVTPQNGTWSVTPTTPLVPGRSYDVATTVRDSAGNTTVDATAGAIVISAPVPPQVIPPQDPVVAPVAPVAASDTALPVIAAPVAPVNLQLAPASIDVAAPGSVASNDTLVAGTAGRAAYGLASVTGIAELRQAAELSDVYTRTEGFRTVVAKADEPALVLFQGVPDQFIDSGNRMALIVPADAFAHTQPKAIVQLTATLQDGRPLPSWVTFIGQTGQFQGDPPAGLTGELRIKLTARDMDGREATALFRINVGQAKALPGKSGLSEQLRQSGAVRGVVRAGGRG